VRLPLKTGNTYRELANLAPEEIKRHGYVAHFPYSIQYACERKPVESYPLVSGNFQLACFRKPQACAFQL
jgi:hypothetical protein